MPITVVWHFIKYIQNFVVVVVKKDFFFFTEKETNEFYEI